MGSGETQQRAFAVPGKLPILVEIDVHIRKEALVTKRRRLAACCCLVSPKRGLIRGGRPCLFKLNQTVLTNVMISSMVVRPCLSVSVAILLAFTTLNDFDFRTA